jgi:hypothetical protein
MKRLVLAIKFGVAAPFEISERTKSLYSNLCSIFFGKEGSGSEVIRVIPVASEHSLSEKAFYDLLRAPIEEVDSTYVLIDVGGPDERDMVRYNILMGLVLTISKFVRANPTVTFGIFFPRLLDPQDVYSPPLQKLAEDIRVRILFGDGSAWGKFFGEHPQEAALVVRWITEAQTSALDLLEQKLIRRVGYYELSGSGQKLLHYYDGQKATAEIYSLALARIRAFSTRHDLDAIRIDARHSHWFFDPVQQAIVELGLTDISEKLTVSNENSNLGARSLVLLPIVRTGQTVREILTNYDEKPFPEIWSLLSTEGRSPRDDTRPVVIEGGDHGRSVQVRYELRVDPSPEKLVEIRRQSRVAPIDPETEKFFGHFRADAMWAMILEAGISIETPIPPHRRGLGYVPDFGEIAQRNGPLVAAKLEATLNQRFGVEIAPQLAFLCPDEPKAVRVARSLQALAGHDTIEVPRGIIKIFTGCKTLEEARNAVDALSDTGKEIAVALDQTHRRLLPIKALTEKLPRDDRPHVVLLDEFGYSGNTILGLFNLASAYNLRILCSVSLASLSEDSLQAAPVPSLSLYSLEYPSS